MINKVYIVIITAIVVLVFATAAFSYNEGMFGKEGPQNTLVNPCPTAGILLPPAGPVTALKAISIAEGSDVFKEWKLNSPVNGIESISTEECDSGLSDAWTIVYARDAGKVSVQVIGGKVSLTVENGTGPSFTHDAGGILDSDRACSLAIGVLLQEGYYPMGPASARLTCIDQSTPVWDLNFPIGGDYYIVRMDGMTGDVVAKAYVGNNPGNAGIIRSGP